MTSEIQVYLQLGFQHIIATKGLDHILFVIALCAIYRLKDWKTVAYLATAFTIGHSITLALATLSLIKFNSTLVELFIPITIVITCIINFAYKFPKYNSEAPSKSYIRYPFALLCGIVHGMGFSTYLKSLLLGGSSIWQPLLSFNIGLEIGQLLIVLVTLIISTIICDGLNVKKQDWNLVLSGIVAGMGLMLIELQLF